MENLSLKPNLAKAIISVMQQVKGVEKSATVGFGTNAYKGVSDQDVKRVVGDAMAAAGLCILPIEINATSEVSRWEESYQGQAAKQKQSVFVEARTRYLLLHESGESIEIAGYGHGVDSQDKAAGKATTYALKYALLYTFLVPTGAIDDADKTHSDEIPTPQKTVPAPPKKAAAKPALKKDSPEWIKAIEYLQGSGSVDAIKQKYNLSPEAEAELINASLA